MSDVLLKLRPLSGGEVAAFAAVLGLLAFFAWRERGAPRARTLLALRAAALAAVALVFLQPGLERRTRVKHLPVAVLVDSSESMSVRDGADGREATRWSAVAEKLGAERNAWDRDFNASWFAFDQKLRKVSPAELPAARPQGRGTDLSLVARALKQSSDARAVVIFTDGRGQAVAEATGAGVPVFAVGAGRDESAPDLAIDSLRAPHFAFKGVDAEVSVRVVRRNLDAKQATLRLTQGERTLATQTVKFSSDTADATLTFRPSAVGRQSFEARLPVYESEPNRKNNAEAFTMDVSRDRLRVLYICGQPGPHYSFLRHQLKTNPSVELVSFVILRDPEDVIALPDQQLSLIPFPSQEMLLGQLRTFDVIIFEQFAFSLFGIGPSGMAALREYVEKGGGLLLAGNSRILGPDGPYRNSPLEEILPMNLQTAPVPGPRRYAFDAVEPDHPVLRLADDAASTRQLWRGAPALESNGFFLKALRPGASLLAATDGGGERQPVLAGWNRGRGRVLMLMSLTSWRWAMLESARGRGTWIYQRFWNNVLRWLAGAEDFQLVKLDVPRGDVAVGAEAMLRAYVRDEGYRPFAGARVQAEIEGPDGQKTEKVLKSLGKGEYGEAFAPDAPGTYRIQVAAFNERRKLGQDAADLTAGTAWDETRDTTTDFPALKRLAESSGGRFVPLKDFSEKWLRDAVADEAWSRERRETLWDSPFLFGVALLLLFADWLLRSLWGRA